MDLQQDAICCVLVQHAKSDFGSGYPGSSPGPGAIRFSDRQSGRKQLALQRVPERRDIAERLASAPRKH